MQKESLDFLSELVDVPSPSGFEITIQDRICKRMAPYCDETRVDVHGNAIGHRPTPQRRLGSCWPVIATKSAS